MAGTRYAVFFNDGPGYLFVAHLGEGTFGQAMLVRSCAFPHNFCVRKRVLSKPNESANTDFHDEVRNYRQFKHIPLLIDWTSYDERSFTITTQFCNGGTLESLIKDTLIGGPRPFAELLVWKCSCRFWRRSSIFTARAHHRWPIWISFRLIYSFISHNLPLRTVSAAETTCLNSFSEISVLLDQAKTPMLSSLT
jgi:hypothetical protein